MARQRLVNNLGIEDEAVNPYGPGEFAQEAGPNWSDIGAGAADMMGPAIEPELMEIPPIPGRGTESPRERIPAPAPVPPPPEGGGGGGATPTTPTRPRPAAPIPPPTNNPPPPFTPLPPVDGGASMVYPRGAGGLYGSLGGLKGGGLGVPFDPQPNAQEDDISALIAALMGGMRR